MTAALLALMLFAQPGHDCTEVQPVRYRTKAPCTGILWPVTFTSEALQKIQVELPECQTKLTASQRELKICDGTIITTRRECDKTIDRIAEITKKAAQIKRPWWDNNTLWGGAGLVTGVVVTVLIVGAAR